MVRAIHAAWAQLEYRDDHEVWPLMNELAEEIAREVKRRKLPDAGNATVMPGNAFVIDNVGNGDTCSEILLNMTGANPYETFPNAPEDDSQGPRMAYTISAGIFRCAPEPENVNGRLVVPSPEELHAAARLHVADMQAVRCAIETAFSDRMHIIGDFVPYGPQGGAYGGTWSVVVGEER